MTRKWFERLFIVTQKLKAGVRPPKFPKRSNHRWIGISPLNVGDRGVAKIKWRRSLDTEESGTARERKKRMQLWFDSIESDHKGDPKRESKSYFSPEKPKSKILRGYCVGQFCPGFQQCKGKGPAQCLVWRDTNIRGRPAEERIKLPSEEMCSMLARSWDCVRGRW